MVDSPKTEMPSSGQDLYDFFFLITLMQNWHQSVCYIIMQHHDESDESIVQYSLMWGMADMQRMQSD